ncbi:MAG TPA: chorismate pyruvate-lyase family protein [Acidimicrobiales bacterium]|nr:chorismate pyruvate-lyase family protein [Acidimicrobiales bacterium]
MSLSDGVTLDFDALSMVQRILLATDGTVTHVLEVYAGEIMSLVKVSHAAVTDPDERAGYGLKEGERGLRRVIVLKGSRTDVPYVYADSVVMLDRLHPLVAEGLLTTDTPIGKLLWRCRAETFREIVAAWEDRDERAAACFGLGPAEPLLARTYDIVQNGRAIARITEKFPKAAFPSPGARAVAETDEVDLRPSVSGPAPATR